MEKVKKIGLSVLSACLWVIILVAALFAFTTLATRDSRSVASIAGFTPLTVASESMEPTFGTNDLIIIKKCDTSTLKEGDIITFHTIINNEYALNTHRIVDIEENNGYRAYRTKGDNNQIEDTHVIADGDIVGKYVLKLAGVGALMRFLSSSTGFLVVIIIPLLIFFVLQVYHLIMVILKLKKATAEENRDASLDEALKAKEEAEAALAEAKRLKEEAEAIKKSAEKKE
ncbi:MAG: signal peptidase I [Solobacterium sp.]|nr:signal peptidase I [Solobacterium sp.]MDY4641119.1 signal peptidase I [Erysipelotrichaceae bacterium]MDY5653843.1 signal peptidase I [Erysipelotrichaceae bacterium]